MRITFNGMDAKCWKYFNSTVTNLMWDDVGLFSVAVTIPESRYLQPTEVYVLRRTGG